MNLPDAQTLLCFVRAADLLNFRQAAAAVHLTPSAFSTRIKQLEVLVGAPLFQRSTRRVLLTEAGSALLPRARAALEATAACLTPVGATNTMTELVVGTRHELGISWLQPALRKLEREFLCHLYFGSGPDLLGRVATHEVDCAITSARISDPRYAAFELHREDYVMVGTRRGRQDVLLDIDSSLPLFRYFRDAPGGFDSMRFSSVRRLSTIAAIKAAARAGEGIAVLPAYFTKHEITQKQLVRLHPKVKLLSDAFRLVFRADDPRRPALERLAQALAKEPLAA